MSIVAGVIWKCTKVNLNLKHKAILLLTYFTGIAKTDNMKVVGTRRESEVVRSAYLFTIEQKAHHIGHLIAGIVVL
jgi:hypothetical protein